MLATIRLVTGLACSAAVLAGLLAGCGTSKGLTGPAMSKQTRAIGVRGDDSEVDRLYSDLQHFGYGGSMRAMVESIEAVTHKYPTQWDPAIDTNKHWEWWKETLSPEIRKDHDTYVRDAVRLAQYRFDVKYYVWVSKQSRGTRAPGRALPRIDFDKEIPVVKAIAGEQGWIVQISPRGTVVDFLQLPEEFLNDYNHVIEIPAELY